MDIPAKSNPAFPFTGKTDVELQTEYILDNLEKILKAVERPFRESEYLPIYQKGRALLHCFDFRRFCPLRCPRNQANPSTPRRRHV
jgi:hypothetical protein